MFNRIKRKKMKKFLILAAACFASGVFAAHADNDRPIRTDELPQNAQQFVKQHFPAEKIAFAKQERSLTSTSYEVLLSNGYKIEFRQNGEWSEVDCKYGSVPPAIVPAQIAQYVSQNYPEVAIVEIERSRRDYEVKLGNGFDLTFDRQFNLIDIDN